MFNQKPAFKFVIKSKIDEQKEDVTTTPLPPTATATETTTTTTAATTTASGIPAPIVPPQPQQPQPQQQPQQQTHPKKDEEVPRLLDDRKRKRTEKESQGTGKKLHTQLKRWNQKKEELKIEQERKEEKVAEKEQGEEELNFANYAALSCILCQRKFKTRADLGKHQEKSELHKNNLKDKEAVEKAMIKLKALNGNSEEPTTEYRNRAAERRQAYGQPEKPILSPPSPPRHQPSKELASLPKASMNTPIADDNKGARMLLQMGWRKGEGLGRHGTGILDPVKAESYAQLAGIGSSSKRDVSNGNESYRNRTLEVARKRFGHD